MNLKTLVDVNTYTRQVMCTIDMQVEGMIDYLVKLRDSALEECRQIIAENKKREVEVCEGQKKMPGYLIPKPLYPSKLVRRVPHLIHKQEVILEAQEQFSVPEIVYQHVPFKIKKRDTTDFISWRPRGTFRLITRDSFSAIVEYSMTGKQVIKIENGRGNLSAYLIVDVIPSPASGKVPLPRNMLANCQEQIEMPKIHISPGQMNRNFVTHLQPLPKAPPKQAPVQAWHNSFRDVIHQRVREKVKQAENLKAKKM